MSSPTPIHWPLHARRRLVVAAAGVAAFLLFRILSWAPSLVETLYAGRLSPLIVRSLSAVSGLVPFSTVEIVWLIYAGVLSAAAARALLAVSRRRRGLGNALLGGTLRLARDAGVYVFLFYFLWGFNYARRPLDQRLGWPEWRAPESEVIDSLASEAVETVNAAYFEIHHSEDAGVPTAMPDDPRELDRALDEGWRGTVSLLALAPTIQARYGPVKPLVLSTPITARLGISGFYFPFTGEANVLSDSPAISRCRSMAHEKAHQRGIAPESEASFLGYLAAALAPHPLARYCAAVTSHAQLGALLAVVDPPAARRLGSRLHPGVQRDLRDAAAYWLPLQGRGTTIGRAVNDRYLRTQGVEGGVGNYGLMIRLLITFAGEQGGTLRPSAAPTAG